jgi:cyclopropane fatty-acyl-phospholipid synthase-like methyltransferase
VISKYHDAGAIADAVERGQHREVVGGMWDEIGDLQLAFLKSRGLEPDDVLLDIGCGSLRLGVRAVEYLRPDHYWGTDLNSVLLDAGYEREIEPAGLAPKLSRSHLVVDGDFSFSGVPSDISFAMATSVFTHLPVKQLGVCLRNLARHVARECTFFFSVFTPPDGHPSDQSYRQPIGGKVTFPDRDPFHYTISDLHAAAADTPWSIDFIGDWDHPRNQKIVKAHKA